MDLNLLLLKVLLYAAVLIGGLLLVKLFRKGSNKKDADEQSSSTNSEVSMPFQSDNSDMQFVKYEPSRTLTHTEMKERSSAFYDLMSKRRSVRNFANKDVPISIIEDVILTAGTSPSGANQQPWTYVVVRDQDMKAAIREVVESEELVNYKQRMGKRWVDDLEKFKTNWIKPYIEDAPCLVAVFRQSYSWTPDGDRQPHYYSEISTCISIGILIAAIHNAGLVTVTTTPLNAGPSIRNLLDRPANEKLLLLLPVGYASDTAVVPAVTKKPLHELMFLK